MKNITRSNSDDNLSVNPISTIVHSKPTAHGAGQRGFGAKDDASSISSQQYFVPSPYQSASSALAGIVNGLIPNGVDFRSLSIPDQQITVGYTKDLSLPVSFLPGEDKIKLKEDVTLRSHNRKTVYSGEILVTKYRLLFVNKSSEPVQVLIDVPLGMISQIVKIGGQTLSMRGDNSFYGIQVMCKDLRQFSFGNAKEQNQRRNLFEQLTRLIFPFSISEADISKPSKFFSSFFAYDYKKAVCYDVIDEGWNVYDKVKDYTRMGIRLIGDRRWKIDREINNKYELCDTYPDILVLPAKFDSIRIQNVAGFRSRNRIPVLSWYSSETGATITRSSQPLTGLNRKCQDDNDYLNEIVNTNKNSTSRLFILDARPRMNALVNKPNGGGYENYSDCELEFQNIQNIHVMRESLSKLYSSIRHASENEKLESNDLENSNWLLHIRTILTSVNRLVSLVHIDKRSVLVHCSDGWDRTAQLTSLAMLMLDGYYRTLDGFMVLIEKEWISFGHKFFLRIGHGDKMHSERSPVFLQFLDCTFQLLQQFETFFEFNEKLLITIADDLYSCQYGTFLLNSEKNRTDMKISRYTMSAWTKIIQNRNNYLNLNYDCNNECNKLVHVNVSTNQIKLWRNYYCRYVPDYQSTIDPVVYRSSTISNPRTNFSNENNSEDSSDSQQQSRTFSFTLTGPETTV